tara:strand:+ start:26 stop:139 length:114 start_codon:yes stop_codon:yes gene_type:complete
MAEVEDLRLTKLVVMEALVVVQDMVLRSQVVQVILLQ